MAPLSLRWRIWFWIIDHFPEVHMNSTFDGWESDLADAHYLICSALDALEQKGEDGLVRARADLYLALDTLPRW